MRPPGTNTTSAHSSLFLPGIASRLLAVAEMSDQQSASLLIVWLRLDPVAVAVQLGHASPAITRKVYAHLYDGIRHADEAREALSWGSDICSPRPVEARVSISCFHPLRQAREAPQRGLFFGLSSGAGGGIRTRMPRRDTWF
jgi:hypothetical protein